MFLADLLVLLHPRDIAHTVETDGGERKTYMYQRMSLCLLEVVESEHWIVPSVEHVPCPVAGFDEEGVRLHASFVLRDNELDALCRDVFVGFDDGLGGDNGDVAAHERGEAGRGKDVRFEGKSRVHD